MAVAANKRSVMTLFSGPTDIYSHQVRIVLAEKGVSFEIEHVEKDNPPQDLIDLNPSQSVPTLVDRELTLWNPVSLWNTWMSVSRIRRSCLFTLLRVVKAACTCSVSRKTGTR